MDNRSSLAVHSSELNSNSSRIQIMGFHKFLIDFKYLFLEQVYNLKLNWYWAVIVSLCLPLALVFGFGHIGGTATNPQSLLYIISGSAIMSVATESIVNMAQRLASFKSQGRLTFYASLPISKVAFILALIISRMGLTMVGMLVPLFAAPLIYNVQLDYNLWIVGILLLTSFSLASIGVALGVLVGDPDLTGQLGNLLLILLLLASPIFIPSSNLFLPFQVIGYLLPPTYAAEALRLAFLSNFNTSFYLDLGMLVVLMLMSFFLIKRYLHWRVN